jgi:hypothetical protein
MSNVNELRGNLWDYWQDGHWVVITTNGSLRADGLAVMGRGVAREAAQTIPNLALELGQRIRSDGNRVHVFSHRRLFTLPVKVAWDMGANLVLIEQGAVQLARLVHAMGLGQVYMVRPGCGNGGLSWDAVRPVLNRHLDSRFNVVEIRDSRKES